MTDCLWRWTALHCPHCGHEFAVHAWFFGITWCRNCNKNVFNPEDKIRDTERLEELIQEYKQVKFMEALPR